MRTATFISRIDASTVTTKALLFILAMFAACSVRILVSIFFVAGSVKKLLTYS